MADIEILHLSDLHWSKTHQADRKIVIDALIRDLIRQRDDGSVKPDLIVFSGDLAQSGDEPDHFESAYNFLLSPALSLFGLSEQSLFIAPGNHDISRESVRSAGFIESGLQASLKSVDDVNKFIDELNSGSKTHLPALDRSQAFYAFVDAKTPANALNASLLRCHLRKIGALEVGIACFDTAWRATGEADDIDRHRLLLGERNVDQALEALSNADFRIAVMHHPADWLADFDEVSTSSRLSSGFDVILCGHTHRTLPQAKTTPQGTAIFSQTGSIYASRRWANGYQSISFDLAQGECHFNVRSYYDTPRREFDAAVNAMPDGGRFSLPYAAAQSKTAPVVESFLRQLRSVIRQNATEHMNLIGTDGFAVADIKEGFVCPPLSRRLVEEGEGGEVISDREVSIEELLRSDENYVITGEREVGRTSLLHYMAVLSAEGVVDRPRIPAILNCSQLKSGSYNLKKSIASYYGSLPKGFDVDDALKSGYFLFLVDDLGSDDQLEAIKAHIETFPANRWICADTPIIGSLTRRGRISEVLSNLREIEIGMLPRRSIRAMAKRWSPAIGHNDDRIFDAVMHQIKRDGLPRTGYMVTLLLWAMRQDIEFDRINEAVLLSNVVDYLLGRADFTQSKHGQFDPRAKEIVLEYLATFLKDRGGTVDLDDATACLVDLFQTKRLPFKAFDVLNDLITCGIIARRENEIAFKYKCFQEYFFASRLRSDNALLQNTMRDLGYARNVREFELLAGLRRDNADILMQISQDLEERAPSDITAMSPADYDDLTEIKLDIKVSQKRINEIKKKRFSADQIDDLMDAADRRALRRESAAEIKKIEPPKEIGSMDLFGKKASNSGEASSGKSAMSVVDFLVSTDLLARVIRNSDFTDYEIKEPATRLVLRNAVRTCLRVRQEVVDVFEEMNARESKDPLSADDKSTLLYLLNQILIATSSALLSDQLNSPNVVPMAREILRAGDLTLAERIFLCFLLQTCRSSNWHEEFSDLLHDRSNNGFVVQTVTNRINRIVNTQYLDDAEDAKLRSVVDTIEEVLGWSTLEKNRMLTGLKKSSLQADLRDARA